jgi:hypothetical protein
VTTLFSALLFHVGNVEIAAKPFVSQEDVTLLEYLPLLAEQRKLMVCRLRH